MPQLICRIDRCEKPVHIKKLGLCNAHYLRFRRHGSPEGGGRTRTFGDPVARYWSFVQRGEAGDCWPWNGALTKGYGAINIGGRTVKAHSMAYELTKGEIPKGMILDHLCHDPLECSERERCPHRRCCNPAHLAAVPPARNAARERSVSHFAEKAFCPQGHPYDSENTYVNPAGRRNCRACMRDSGRKYRERKKAGA